MNKNIKAIAVVLLILILPIIIPVGHSYTYSRSLSYYPSYLMLGNWVNTSMLIITGIPIPNASLNRLKNRNTTITNIYLGGYGIIPLNITFFLGRVSSTRLTLNNTVNIKGEDGKIIIASPPHLPSFIAILKPAKYIGVYITIPRSYSITSYGNYTVLLYNKKHIRISIYYNGSKEVIHLANETLIKLKYKANGYLELGINTTKYYPSKYMIAYNEREVNNWLYRSKMLKASINRDLAYEYFLSLLFLKDQQNPYLGIFASSPSPRCLYSSIIVSSFASLALQDSGHYISASKFWQWMADTAKQNSTWYKEYNFYTGHPLSKSFPSLIAIGLFQLGIYDYFQITHNITFLSSVLPVLNKTLNFEFSQIRNNRYSMLPMGVGVWGNKTAYHFSSEAIDDLGIYYVSKIYQYLGINTTTLKNYEKVLNQSIIRYFWNGNFFYSSIAFNSTSTGREKVIPIPPYYDSLTILPMALGYLQPKSSYASSDVIAEVSRLAVSGGIARYVNDFYHYNVTLHDSSTFNPPWVVTTMFLSYYYDKLGSYSKSLALLNWVFKHSQSGLIPQAIDPKYGNPLPTTSPSSWSTAMFVLSLLGIHNSGKPSKNSVMAWVIIIMLLVVLSYVMERRSVLKK
ncbi:MAG: hypothetical protein G5Z42_01620 [Caldisphaeraceae archaeon]|nr:hypothetical protein [Caldisphaeraceae archaeon]MEB3797504.1 hypothetical protein [Caldisphaeraceae archaeon]